MTIEAEDYRLTLFGTGQGQELVNVFYYKRKTTGDAQELTLAFLGDLIPTLLPVISSDCNFYRIYTTCMSDPGDFYDYSIDENGASGADSYAKWNCWYFKYHRTTNLVRDGRKSFGLIPESLVTDGVATAGAITLLNALAVDLQTSLSGGSGGIFDPCILKTEAHEPDEDHEHTWYTPETLYTISDVSYQRISTQNSRKR